VPAFVTLTEGRTYLRKLLARKRCLLILDDVWQVKHATALLAVEAPGRVLVTTRNGEVLRGLDASEQRVDVLAEDEGRELLAKCAHYTLADLPAVAERSRGPAGAEGR
jgi:hypothetical protein